MYSVIVAKADPVGGRSVPDVRIEIAGKLPSEWASPGEWDDYCEEQASAIDVALFLSLPGGVYDQLLALMLSHKASRLRIAHEDEPRVTNG